MVMVVFFLLGRRFKHCYSHLLPYKIYRRQHTKKKECVWGIEKKENIYFIYIKALIPFDSLHVLLIFLHSMLFLVLMI